MPRLAYWYRAWYVCLSPHIYMYTRIASTLHTLHLIMPGDMLFLPSSRAVPLFFSPLELARRARISRARIHNPSETNGRKFLHAICRAAAYFGARPDRCFAVHFDYRALRAINLPLIWKYSVTIIKDTLDITAFSFIIREIFEWRSLLIDESGQGTAFGSRTKLY